MKVDALTWVVGGLGAGMLIYAGSLFRSNSSRQRKAQKTEKRTLAEVSGFWTGKDTIVDFREIARIWRVTPEAKAEPKPSPTYCRKEINDFHTHWVDRPVVKGEKKEIIETILTMLDQNGNCPSVVRKHAEEAEGKYDKDVFAKLATVPLWQHSIGVAAEAAGRMKQAILVPDALIAGLGHDLGKIPAYQEPLYRTGDHPVISIIALNRIPGYESVANRDEISQAIRQHHLLKPDSPLAMALKEADQHVRLAEISRLTTNQAASRRETEKPSTISKVKPVSKQPPKEPTEVPDVPKGPEDLPSAPKSSAKEDSVSSLNMDRLLAAMKRKINRLEKGRWSIVSTPEGLVFVQPDALWTEAKKLSSSDPDFLVADGDEECRRKVLGQIVNMLSDQKQAIATEYLGDGYHTTQCLIIMDNGRTLQVPLIPFKAEAFGVLPSALEALKSDALRRMVKRVKTRVGAKS